MATTIRLGVPALAKATLAVIESGRMTGDLALITSLPNPEKMGSEDFLDAIAEEYDMT